MAEYMDMSRAELSSSHTFSGQLEDFKQFCLERADEFYYDLVLSISTRIIDKSPVDTGRFKANWQYSVNSYVTSSLNQYDISGIGPDQEGIDISYNRVDARSEMISEIGSRRPRMGDTVYIYNNLVYSVPLEYGWSKKAPSGVVRTTLAIVGGNFDASIGRLSL